MKHKPKVLIVEDNVHNHDLYRKVFEETGFDVVIKDGADEFFPETVSEIAPDIISMDLMIGENGEGAERDGFWAIDVLKKDLRTHTIPVIVLTSFFEEGRVRKAKELGAVDFITSSGLSIQKIPEYFKRYLENPERYKPIHPLFREE